MTNCYGIKWYKSIDVHFIHQNNECLEELDVSWNGIGPEGCVHLGRMLGTNQGLRLLNLSNNRVNIAGLGHIIDGISQNETLQTIKVSPSF